MTDVNMPEPKGQRLAYRCVAGYGEDEYEDFYTEAQLKQYGDDRARGALEMAAKTCQNLKKDCGEPDSIQASLNRQMMSCADAIRALAKEIKQ